MKTRRLAHSHAHTLTGARLDERLRLYKEQADLARRRAGETRKTVGLVLAWLLSIAVWVWLANAK